ncbi:MAG: hypothetical protein MZV63_38635 [Marinilabiliales bacterium]|nr:hypothetical protein [Marinilabiliales bacterium]
MFPWHNRVILGTTDIPVKEFVLEPKALDEEVDFILETAGRYLAKETAAQRCTLCLCRAAVRLQRRRTWQRQDQNQGDITQPQD